MLLFCYLLPVLHCTFTFCYASFCLLLIFPHGCSYPRFTFAFCCCLPSYHRFLFPVHLVPPVPARAPAFAVCAFSRTTYHAAFCARISTTVRAFCCTRTRAVFCSLHLRYDYRDYVALPFRPPVRAHHCTRAFLFPRCAPRSAPRATTYHPVIRLPTLQLPSSYHRVRCCYVRVLPAPRAAFPAAFPAAFVRFFYPLPHTARSVPTPAARSLRCLHFAHHRCAHPAFAKPFDFTPTTVLLLLQHAFTRCASRFYTGTFVAFYFTNTRFVRFQFRYILDFPHHAFPVLVTTT